MALFVRFIYCLLGSLVCLMLPATAQERHALLIGNEAYYQTVGRLKNPVNDVNLIAGSLIKAGFPKDNITIITDADRISMLTAVDTYVDRVSAAGKDAIGFFYYSGHGVANNRDRRNYLIPVGVKSLDRQVWFKAIALDDIVAKLSQLASNAAHFVVFDACRNLLNSPVRGGKGFVPIAERRGMLIAFSTDPGETATDEGAHSGPYAEALAAELAKRGQHHLDLFQNVKERVHRKTKVQVPWTRDGMLERIYLRGKRPSADLRAETTFWGAVKSSGDLKAVRAYINAYPNGRFLEPARILASELESAREQSLLAEKKQRKKLALADERRRLDLARRLATSEAELRAVREANVELRARELKLAEEKQRQAELQKQAAERRIALARKEKELQEAVREAKRTKAALEVAQKARRAAEEAAKKARAEREQAQQQAKNKQPTQVAALSSNNQSVAQQPATGLAGPELIRQIQRELTRVGCNPGPIDGQWGSKGKAALKQYASLTKASLESEVPGLAELSALKGSTKRVCPRSSTPKRTTSRRKRNSSTSSSSSGKSAGKCFQFNGKTYCQ